MAHKDKTDGTIAFKKPKMVSLKKISALPIFLAKGGLRFSPALKHDAAETRTYKGNEVFFMPQNRLDFSGPLYYIYRNVRFPAHNALFKKQGIRFDITVLCAGHTRHEAIRTIGHIHKRLSKNKRPAEMYQVLYGNAIFYLQHEIKKKITLIRASAGSFVYIPGEYGHITINASPKKPLVIANIFTRKKHSSDYTFFRKTHGPALFPIWRKSKLTFIKNELAGAYAITRATAQKKIGPLYPFN